MVARASFASPMLGLAQYWMPGWQMPMLPYGVVQVRCSIAGSSMMPLQLLSFSSQISVVGPGRADAGRGVERAVHALVHAGHARADVAAARHVHRALRRACRELHAAVMPSSYLPSQSLSMPSQTSGAPGHVPHAVRLASFSSNLPSQSSSKPACEQVSLTWPHTICCVTGVVCAASRRCPGARAPECSAPRCAALHRRRTAPAAAARCPG